MWIQPEPDGADQRISLAGPWRCKPGFDMKDFPPLPRPPQFHSTSWNRLSVLYNAMAAPLTPLPVKGVIWYQGEANVSRARQYEPLFQAMIQDWREHWQQERLPFLFVQLANFLERKAQPEDDAWAELRESQMRALALPNTGMAVAIDIGEADDIHPRNKQDVGLRLALAALGVAYGQDLVYSGPLYSGMTREDGAIRIQFEHTGSGLVVKGGELRGFAIAGEDREFVWADAVIEGDAVVVRSRKVPHPVAVRYGWAANPDCNLYNAEGLPASPFRTDEWPGITEDATLEF
jgi:sialate O-acetylesterase